MVRCGSGWCWQRFPQQWAHEIGTPEWRLWVGHAKAASLLGGPCAHCGATESPQWRRPLTKKMVLCNACGIYYSRHHSLPKGKKVSVYTTQRCLPEVTLLDIMFAHPPDQRPLCALCMALTCYQRHCSAADVPTAPADKACCN